MKSSYILILSIATQSMCILAGIGASEMRQAKGKFGKKISIGTISMAALGGIFSLGCRVAALPDPGAEKPCAGMLIPLEPDGDRGCYVIKKIDSGESNYFYPTCSALNISSASINGGCNLPYSQPAKLEFHNWPHFCTSSMTKCYTDEQVKANMAKFCSGYSDIRSSQDVIGESEKKLRELLEKMKSQRTRRR